MPLKPYVLKGHSRPVTMLKFSAEGDILFSASRGKHFAAWWTKNGERIGTYNGHNGSVYCIDVTRDCTKVLSCAADNKAKLWDAETGKELFSFDHIAPVRVCGLRPDDKQFFTINDAVMGNIPVIRIFDIAENPKDQNSGSRTDIPCQNEGKVLCGVFGPDGDVIITGCTDGTIRIYDVSTSKCVKVIRDHKKAVTGLQLSKDGSLMISASQDTYARMYDTKDFENIRTFHSGRPVNSAAISPLKPHCLVAGGQSAESVTTTRVDASQFHTAVFNMAFEKEIAALPGHFGPVNYVAWSPDGKAFVTGGEDGFVRYNPLSEDADYMNDVLDKKFMDHFATNE